MLTGTIVDPSAKDTFGVTVDWGDGSAASAVTVAAAAPQLNLAHQYASAGTFTLSVAVNDGKGGSITVPASATVNAAPASIASAGFLTVASQASPARPASSIPEGGQVVLAGTIAPGAPSDTDTVSVNWGDGSAATQATVNNAAHTFSATHIYVDNPAGAPSGRFTATVTATDQTKHAVTGTASIQVINQPPAISSLAVNGVVTANLGGNVTVTGGFIDPGALDTHTATISWGDGTRSAAVVDDTHHTFTASHAYAGLSGNGAPVALTVTASVGDNSGARDTETTALAVGSPVGIGGPVAPSEPARVSFGSNPASNQTGGLPGGISGPGNTSGGMTGGGSVGVLVAGGVTIGPVAPVSDAVTTGTITATTPHIRAGSGGCSGGGCGFDGMAGNLDHATNGGSRERGGDTGGRTIGIRGSRGWSRRVPRPVRGG